jgi:hypothetical protein
MQKYADLSGDAGVGAYEIGENSIVLEFNNGRTYLYNEKKPGLAHVKAMTELAVAGDGLTTYVNKYVRDNYFKRLK